MKADIILWSIVGLLASGAWVAIIWAISKYDPSPWWGLLCFPIVALAPLFSLFYLRISSSETKGGNNGERD